MRIAAALTILWIVLCSRYENAADAKSFIESCNTASQCTSLVAYKSPSRAPQKLQDIAALFNIDTVSLLGANNLDLTVADPENILIGVGQLVKVPITCSCLDGIWRGNSTVYKVKPGDTLSLIADDFFSKLVTFKQIAQANAISNPSNIQAGTMLVIPFPCACNGNTNVTPPQQILLSYVVQPGDTVNKLVTDYGTTYQSFMALNNMNNASQLVSGDVVAIPVHACSSDFRRSALDFGLVVPNGTYVITAGHCVQCSCLPNLEQVYCTPAPATISGSCPAMSCIGTNLTIGKMTSTKSLEGCNVTSCLYAGYKKRVILSSLQTANLNSCPASPPPPNYRSASGSSPSTVTPAMAPAMRGEPGTIPSTQVAQAPAPSSSPNHGKHCCCYLVLLVAALVAFRP